VEEKAETEELLATGAPTELYQEAVAVEPETEPMKSAATVLQDASS